MAAFRVLRDWLDAWAVPATPPPQGDRSALPSCNGAQAVLRLENRTIGRGGDTVIALAGDRDHTTERAVWRAFLAAFAEADRRLPVPTDARRADAARALARDVTISLELAGAATPITPDRFADFDRLIEPGVEGLAARLGNRVESAFPSAMLLSNTSPSEAARALVAKLSNSSDTALAEAADLRAKPGIVFLKFRVIHLAQTAPRDPPRFLFRGAALADTDGLDASRLRLMADAIARHLRLRLSDDDAPLGLRGVYRPWTGDFATPFAQPHEQALAALALRRFARQPWASAAGAEAAAVTADRILHDLDDVDLSEPRPWDDPGAAALCVLALREPSGPYGAARAGGEIPHSHVDLLARCTERVLDAFSPGKGFPPDLAPPARAAVAAALLRIDGRRADADAAIRECFKSTPPALLPGLMPLLAWAEIDAAHAADASVIPAASALRQMRQQLWMSQVTLETTDPRRADGVGGIEFAPGAGPDWQSFRPLAACAAMLRVPALTPAAEAPAEIARLIRAARFLRQIQADDSLAWMYAAPGVAQGGIRAAPRDQHMPPDASSIGLLFLCELMQSLDARR